MRKVNVKDIKKSVEELCIRSNTVLRSDILRSLKKAYKAEKNDNAKDALKAIIENAKIAKRDKIAICQDTGMVSIYIEIGKDVRIIGGSLVKSVNRGVVDGYKKGAFRKSIVKDPLIRINTGNNTPSILKVKEIPGKRVRICLSPKGFGSENKSRIKMFNPTASLKDIKKFIVDTVRDAGPEACPPFVVGIGLGGTFDKAAALAKESLLRPIDRKNTKTHLAALEKSILKEINRLKIGPMGLGGNTTALGVNILSYPTHIAGMPVAVNISCHATRSSEKTI